jgi:hypothetical protein
LLVRVVRMLSTEIFLELFLEVTLAIARQCRTFPVFAQDSDDMSLIGRIL